MLLFLSLCLQTAHHMAAQYRVLLPKTKFPLRVNPLIQEPLIQKTAAFNHLYKWQLDRPNATENFTLHDGPPHANGEPHMGHVLNKVLKDIVNRYKMMRGYRVHYRPGWDCHGLPIELKACKEMDFQRASPSEIRRKATMFAQKTMKLQKEAFQRWGCMGDWERPYLTMDPDYEVDQIRVFYQMYKKGCIYRGFKPVYWSPSSGTALAEAELEYRDHTSQAVHVLFPITSSSLSILQERIGESPSPLDSEGGETFALVWTTTPWTLVANKAICYHPNHSYCLLQIEHNSETKQILVGAECLPRLEPILGEYSIIATFSGSAFEDVKYKIPLGSQAEICPFVPGDHVTETEGSGLVHTAPAHGFEDYSIGVNHGLELDCIVSAEGRYTSAAGSELENLSVLGDGSKAIISELKSKGALYHESSYFHRYPYDWRTKKPIIIRSTEQWFASVVALKEKAKSSLEDVTMHPASSLNRLTAFLDTRNDWCISRQRVWGVPLPIFYEHETGEPLVNKETIEKIEAIFRKRGSDAWWNMDVSELLPSSMQNKASKYIKGTDTMDVWFDSGSSWAAVLKNSSNVADLYLEGSDQHRGWFQSSLLTSVAAQGRAPYRSVVTHGFVLDGKGIKMSKSLGNVISPNDILSDNSKSKKKFGADTMRLWTAFSNYSSDVHLSDGILEQSNDFLQKIRNTCRFILGNLSSFDVTTDLLSYSQLSSLDRYMLHLLSCYSLEATRAYETFNFSRLQSLLMRLVPIDLSSFYFDIIKDRLYCDSPRSLTRSSTQSVLYLLLQCLTKSIAPVVPHLAEEVAQHFTAFESGKFCLPYWVILGYVHVHVCCHLLRTENHYIIELLQTFQNYNI